MILDTTSKTIELILSGAKTTNDCDFTVDYADTASGTTFVPSGGMGTTNGVTAVTAVPAPSGSTQRHIKAITVYNADTVNSTVTVRMFDGTNRRIMIKALLGVGQSLVWTPEGGWSTPGITLPTVPSFYWSMHLGADQTFTVSTSPLIQMDTIDADPNGWCDAVTHKGRVTPTKAGKYLVTVNVGAQGTTGPAVGGELCRASIGLNGTQVKLNVTGAQVASLTGAGNAAFATVSCIITVNGSTDFIEPFGNSDTSAPKYRGDARFTFFTGTYIGP